MMKQALVLAGRPHIVIATPGRLADHLQSSPDIALAFKRIKILVRMSVEEVE
jgi:ATP-dependent RNA helicase DDX49/DBP8